MGFLKKQDILIYGAGNFFDQNYKNIERSYNIKAIIDKNKQGNLGNWEIIKIEEHSQFIYEKIVVMIADVGECLKVIKDLLRVGVDCEKIVWGGESYGFYADKYDEIKVTFDGKLCVNRKGTKIAVGTVDEFKNVYETLVNECYCYKVNNSKKDVVIDVGMNIGDTTLYFLTKENVEKVYAFEPFQDTFRNAKQNLETYIDNTDRLEIFQYGLSNVTEERMITFNQDMTCGLSTLTEEKLNGFNVYGFYYSNGLAEEYEEKAEKIEVKDVVDVLSPIIEKYKQHKNIVLKLDCEGEEYGIIEALFNGGLLDKIAFIMLEWHYKGKESLLYHLEKAGFSWWCNDRSENMGMVYAYKN